MTKPTATKHFEWDVAISLCKQDIGFAKELVKTINPSLKVFFYEDRQEELISKSGPEAFAKIFKEKSRVVVILSRDDWSKSFYTEIERNAIIDRIKNDGYQFLMIIPMVQGEIPPWYPSTQIYVNPFRFSVEEIVRFIEFKVAEKGGVLKSLTVEDRYQNLIDRIEKKKSIINLQRDKIAIESARGEIATLKDEFNKKNDFFRESIFDVASWFSFNENVDNSHLSYGGYLLQCQFALPRMMYYGPIETTQDFWVRFEIFKIFGNAENGKSLEVEERVFYYTPKLQGWALPHLYEQATNEELQVLFHNRDYSQFYDLTNPLRSATLVDNWFQRFFSKSTQSIERHI